MSTEYIKTSWQDGDIITADKMNNIENGIKDVEDTTTSLKEDLSVVLSLRNATSNRRFMAIPYDFENGKSYIVKLFYSDTTVSGIRIASAANLNSESSVQGFIVNDTKAEVEYKCESSIAKYLIVICPSNVTQFTFTISLYEGGIFDDVYILKNDTSKQVSNLNESLGLVLSQHNTVSYQRFKMIPYSFINGHKYIIRLTGSDETVSQIRISSASNINSESIVKSFVINDTKAEIEYQCDSDDAKYLIVLCASTTTQFMFSLFMYDGGIYSDIYTLKNVQSVQEEVPAYSVDYLNGKIITIMNQIMNGGSNSDVFGYYTDTHFPANSGESGKYLAYLAERLPMKKAFFGGDICPAYSSSYSGATSEQACTRSITEQFDAINKSLVSFDLFQCKGNHDFHVSSQTDASDRYMMNPQQSRNIIMGGSDLCNVVTDNDNLSACYYYVDNPSQNIRYVIMDSCEFFGVDNEWVQTYGMSDNQINWIVNSAIKTALGRNFIFLAHCGLVDMTCTNNQYATFAKIENIIRALNEHRTYTSSGVTYDFTSATGRVLAVITGHEHQDLNTFVSGVPHVSVACDAMYGDYKKSFIYTHFNSVPPTKVSGTVEEVTFDVVNVDDKSIKFNRIGGGGDRFFNFSGYEGTVGQTVTISPNISGVSAWWCYDASGRTSDSNYVITPTTNRASVSDGVVTCSSVGEVVVVAKNDNDEYEFFDLIIS